jgi:hypothetical protein
MVRLKEIAEKDFPSALTSYIRNPIQFYFRKYYASAKWKKERKYCLEYFGNHYSRNSLKGTSHLLVNLFQVILNCFKQIDAEV